MISSHVPAGTRAISSSPGSSVSPSHLRVLCTVCDHATHTGVPSQGVPMSTPSTTQAVAEIPQMEPGSLYLTQSSQTVATCTLGVPWQLGCPFLLSLDEGPAEIARPGERTGVLVLTCRRPARSCSRRCSGWPAARKSSPLPWLVKNCSWSRTVREASARGISTKLSPKKEAGEEREKGQPGKGTSCQPRPRGCCDPGASQAHPSALPLFAG